MTACLGGLQFGFAISLFSPLQDPFTQIFKWTDKDSTPNFALFTTLTNLGAAFGALFGGVIIQIGKLKCMQIVCLLVILSGVLTEITNEYSIAVGRFIFGIAAGSITVYVPKYVEEISPSK